MLNRLANLLARHGLLIIVGWLAVVWFLQSVAPRWDSITRDGDFAYLPEGMPSVRAEQWLTLAFSQQRAQSQMVIAVVREDRALSAEDLAPAYDIVRRVQNWHGAARLARARQLQTRPPEATADTSQRAENAEQIQTLLADAQIALDDAIHLDERLAEFWDAQLAANPALQAQRPPRLAAAYHNRALLETLRGNPEEARRRFQIARRVAPTADLAEDSVQPAVAASLPLLDVWTWHESYFGDKLLSRDRMARLIVLQLSNEFMAVDNIRVMRLVEAELDQVRATLLPQQRNRLAIELTGSAAVGGDLLRSSAASIRHTELITIVLVILILAFVYRAPLLVAVPLATIGTSLFAATNLVALLTRLDTVPGFSWWSLQVFSTTRIFIVVILFGAGTDYCLFLIARYKEELRHGRNHASAVVAALRHVGDALIASALTTILGLGMMFCADFGKFRHSGPVIGLCLAVTLLACLTFTPALMLALGRALFWPLGIGPDTPAHAPGTLAPSPTRPHRRSAGRESWSVWIWRRLAQVIVTRPGLLLIGCSALLAPLAGYGLTRGNYVTYDFLSGLPDECPSRRGAAVLKRHFPVGESGPVVVLARREGLQLESPAGREQIRDLSDRLHLPGVQTVRSLEDPLGEFQPGEKLGIVSPRARRLRLLRAHPRTKALFVPQVPALAGSLARFDVVTDYDPFSLSAVQCVERIEQTLQHLSHDPQSFWYGAEFALTGTAAAIRDLRTVTRHDNVLIQLLVVAAVYLVLLVILRRPLICLYLMLTVLVSYYVTLALTQSFFAACYGPRYHGMDWKTPLFLFVILVAVGQDYNVYLVTRVFEEQQRLGPFAGLRRAVVCTGGIITSCGIIMAGTFFSMTGSAWSHWIPGSTWLHEPGTGALRSIVELGFALALGVLIDTFVVRPILVPAFLALVCRWRAGRSRMPRL